MGVDLATYRGRIGVFVGHCCAGLLMQPSFNTVCTYSMLIRIFGAVSFVRMLLLIAGVEQNPGPDLFIFKYQYLLVNVGTEVLRKLFDKLTSNDAATYLNGKAADIQKLKVLTTTQKNLLPPVNNKPDIADFDITLLSCLLRNVCGLCPPKDTVWMAPDRADISIEADITRLRMCRNDLMHSDRLRLPAVELDAKWTNLCTILTRLNKRAAIAELPKLINEAERMDVDEELSKKHNETISEWASLDDRIDELKHEIIYVRERVDRLEQKQQTQDTDLKDLKELRSEVKHDKNVVKERVDHLEQKQRTQDIDLKDIQRDIISFYKQTLKKLHVLPLVKGVAEDLSHSYQFPTLYSIDETKDDKKEQIDSYEDIFCKEKKSCQHIYITGEAGTGKTSFCRHLCLIWSFAKCGENLDNEYQNLMKDVDYISKFEYVFYINLRDTSHTLVLDMIIEQFHLSKEYGLPIRTILRDKQCLVLMDGMDEWSPKKNDGKNPYIPVNIYSGSCVYLTTCRPYRLESVRLSHRSIDHQIQLTGISGDSSQRYIENVIKCLNKQTSSDKKVSDFNHVINKCGLEDQLCIPLITSQLVLLWFVNRLTDMPRAIIYSNIIEMLFERALQRGVDFPPSSASQNRGKKSGTLSSYFHDKMSHFKSIFTDTRLFQLPGSLSGLRYLNEFVNLLYKVCLLSFDSMFKQEDNVASLIFTREQLESEHCFSFEEIDFLCKIGLLSKNEVVECISVEKLKISFIHKTYLEYFAALYISTFNSSKLWKCLDDVLPCENLLVFLAGFSYDGEEQLFDNIYLRTSDDLTLIRRNAIFHYDNVSYKNQIKSLQNIVVKCFKEFRRSKAIELKVEDFIFDDDTDTAVLRKLLGLNRKCVKSIHSVKGKYYPEFDQIHCLQCINVVRVSSADIGKFTQCMLQNKLTLHTVCIEGSYNYKPLIPELLVRSLHHLTSLSLYHVKMQHNSLHYLVNFLSDNVLIENIKLSRVSCVNHWYDDDSDCTLTLNLPQHTKLTSLCLWNVNILCNNVNNSSLKSVTLSERIVRLCYNDLFNCLNYSQLEHLNISGSYRLDNKTLKTLTSTVKSLPCLKSLTLWDMKLPDDVLLQLHPQVTQVMIMLDNVTMSRQCFHCFVESCVNKSDIKVKLYLCKIRSVDGETHSVLSWEKSVKYMSEHLESISTINITRKDDRWPYIRLYFETRSCQ